MRIARLLGDFSPKPPLGRPVSGSLHQSKKDRVHCQTRSFFMRECDFYCACPSAMAFLLASIRLAFLGGTHFRIDCSNASGEQNFVS